MQETWVPFLGGEDPLKEEMAIHSSILSWKSPIDRRALRAAVYRVAQSQYDWAQHSTKIKVRRLALTILINILLEVFFFKLLPLW